MCTKWLYVNSILVGLIGLAISGNALASDHVTGPPVAIVPFGEEFQKKGVVDTASEVRLNAISLRTEKHQALTNDDITFCSQLLKRGPLVSTPNARSRFYAIAFGDMGGRKNLTVLQRKKLFAAILPYAYDAAYLELLGQGKSGASVRCQSQILAISVMTSARDARGLNVLKYLEKSSALASVRSAVKQQFSWLSLHADRRS